MKILCALVLLLSLTSYVKKKTYHCTELPLQSEQKAYLYRGTVTDIHASPISGARVQAMSLNNDDYGVTYYGETMTDSIGHFSLSSTSIPETLQVSRGNLYAVVQKPKLHCQIKVVMKKKKS